MFEMDLVSELSDNNRTYTQLYGVDADESDEYDERITSYCNEIMRHVNNLPKPKICSRETYPRHLRYKNRIIITNNDSKNSQEHRSASSFLRENSGNPLTAPKGCIDIGTPSFNRTQEKNQYAEKSTYCRPAVDMYSKEFIFKTLQRNARLKGLMKKLIQARENEKRDINWKRYLKDLKAKLKPYKRSNPTMPIEEPGYSSLRNSDYYTYPYRSSYNQHIFPTYFDSSHKRMGKAQDQRENLFSDLMFDIDYPVSLQAPDSLHNLKNNTYVIPDVPSPPPVPPTPRGSLINVVDRDVIHPSRSKRCFEQRQSIRLVDVNKCRYNRNMFTQTTISKNILATQTDTNNKILSTQTELWKHKSYAQTDIVKAKFSTQTDFNENLLFTQADLVDSKISMQSASTEVKDYSHFNLTTNESFKDKMNKVSGNIERLKQKLMVSEVEVKFSKLSIIERKLDDLIQSISNLMSEIKCQKLLTSSACGEEQVNKIKNSASYVIVESRLSRREILSDAMHERAISDVAIVKDNCQETLYKILKENENTKLDIEDIINKPSRSCSSGHITFKIPTKEGNNIRERRFKIDPRAVYVHELVSEHSRMTIAVNTDPLGLSGLLRVSVEAVRQILSFVPQIDYYWYLSKLPIAKSKNVYEYVCNICGAAFERPSRLSEHLKGHSLGNTRDCCVCRHALESYRRKEGLFTCRHCGQRFTRAYCKELHEIDCARALGKDVPSTSKTSSLVILR